MRRKRIFRYPLSDLYMLVGLVTAFLALFFSRAIADHNFARAEDQKKYEYREIRAVTVMGDMPPDYTKLLQDASGMISMPDVSVVLNDYGYTCLAEVVFKGAEAINMPLCEGEYPFADGRRETTPVVLLGRKLAEASYLRDGQRYMQIQNEEYRVSGIVGVETSDALDYELILYWDACGQNVSELIQNMQTMTFQVKTNQSSGNTAIAQLFDNVKKYGLDNQILLADSETSSVYSTSGTDNKLFHLLYLFCMVNCLIISEFWISERRYDVAVRRIWGYNRWKMFWFLYGQLLRPLCAAVVVCLLMQGFSGYLQYEGVPLAIRLTPNTIVLLFVEILLSAAVISFCSLKQTDKAHPVDAIRTF